MLSIVIICLIRISNKVFSKNSGIRNQELEKVAPQSQHVKSQLNYIQQCLFKLAPVLSVTLLGISSTRSHLPLIDRYWPELVVIIFSTATV